MSRRTFLSLRDARGLTAAALVAVVLFSTVASAYAQTPASNELGSVEFERYGGADRYATSLQIAEAVVERAGGSVKNGW